MNDINQPFKYYLYGHFIQLNPQIYHKINMFFKFEKLEFFVRNINVFFYRFFL